MAGRVHRAMIRASCTALVALAVLVAGCSDDGDLLSDPPPGSVSSTAVPTTVVPATTSTPPTTTPAPPTTVAFEPPHPQTTPNVTQPADSLLDGMHVVFLVDVDVAGRTTDVDVVQWFSADDFATAVAEGRLASDDPCLELDYCIANAQDRVRTLGVAPDARVSVVDWEHCCGSVRTDDLFWAFTRMREGRDLFLVTVKSGSITALDEIYVP